MRNDTDVELAAIDSETCFVSTIRYDGKLDEKTDCYFQCALLYTTIDGRRFIRIHNFSIPVTSVLIDLFRHVEADCVINMMAKKSKTFFFVPHLFRRVF
jgi:protein transport protein SEC24